MEIGNHARRTVRVVFGPDGAPLSVADLPPPETRWVPRRKAEVVAAVRGGLLSIAEACDRYNLTREEFLTWHAWVTRFGKSGLRATKLQHYRNTRED